MHTPFTAAVTAKLYSPESGLDDLPQLQAARSSVDDRQAFDAIFIGLLAATTPSAVWSAAIAKALEDYKAYRSL